MSPFAIIITLLFAGSTSALTFLFLNDRKSRHLLEKQQAKQQNLQDEINALKEEQIAIEAESDKQLTQLKNEIQELHSEKEQAFEKGKQASMPDLNQAQSKIDNAQSRLEKYEEDLVNANHTISQLKQKVANFDIERHKILLEELNDNVNLGQKEILHHLDGAAKIEDLVLPINQDENLILSFEKIIETSNIQLERHYLSESFKPSEDEEEKTLYVILFSASGNVTLIDGKLSAFLEKNYQYLHNPSPAIKEQIINILQERINFLTSTEFKDNIKLTLEELDNIRNISNIHSCIYFPSELIIEKLAQIDDFSRIIENPAIHSLSPASLVNVIQTSKFLYETEQEIIKYQILADIISDFHLEELAQSIVTETAHDDIEDLDEEEEETENNAQEEAKEEPLNPEILAEIGLNDLDLSGITGEKAKNNFTDNLPEEQEKQPEKLAESEEEPQEENIENGSPESNNQEEDDDTLFDDLTLEEDEITSQTKKEEEPSVEDDSLFDDLELDEETEEAEETGETSATPEAAPKNNEDDLDIDLDDLELEEDDTN